VSAVLSSLILIVAGFAMAHSFCSNNFVKNCGAKKLRRSQTAANADSQVKSQVHKLECRMAAFR
jgi:hypothetical protein